METIWTKGIEAPVYPKLMNDISADALVIGGGMAGILCAKRLTDAGIDCVVLEADRVGRGITSGTTAVISAQHSVLGLQPQGCTGAFGACVGRGL